MTRHEEYFISYRIFVERNAESVEFINIYGYALHLLSFSAYASACRSWPVATTRTIRLKSLSREIPRLIRSIWLSWMKRGIA